jgi:hypothetical protein
MDDQDMLTEGQREEREDLEPVLRSLMTDLLRLVRRHAPDLLDDLALEAAWDSRPPRARLN